ncbi:MAG: hypothetical protein ACXVLQ_08800 [Bacteriovorax sp.]
MHTGAKINFKKYSLFSAVLLIASYLLAKSNAEFIVMLSVFIAACLNQWMLVNVVKEATRNAADGSPVDKVNMIMMIIGKVVLVMAALSFGVHIMGNRIIIPVLIYVLQIVVLYLSFEKIAETGAEKGSK